MWRCTSTVAAALSSINRIGVRVSNKNRSFYPLISRSNMATTVQRKRKADINPYDQALPFTFDLVPSSLVLVDCPSQFRDVASFFGSVTLMGIDTETKPNFVAGETKHRTALMQVAVRTERGDERVYIFDLTTLLPRHDNELNTLLEPSMESDTVIKLGQALNSDLSDLSTAYPTLSCFRNVRGILEVNALARVLQPQLTHAIGLKKLTQIYLNYNLVKSQQMSNWAKRPLTTRQIHYAACDALVLLRLYDAMTMEIIDLFGEYNVKSLCKSYQRQQAEKEIEARQNQKARRSKGSKKRSPKPPTDASAETASTTNESSDGLPSEADSDVHSRAA